MASPLFWIPQGVDICCHCPLILVTTSPDICSTLFRSRDWDGAGPTSLSQSSLKGNWPKQAVWVFTFSRRDWSWDIHTQYPLGTRFVFSRDLFLREALFLSDQEGCEHSPSQPCRKAKYNVITESLVSVTPRVSLTIVFMCFGHGN